MTTNTDTPTSPAAAGRDVPVAHRGALPWLPIGGAASVAAGAVHAVAAGGHAEHAALARVFVAVAVCQIGSGVLALVRPRPAAALALAAVNVLAVGGWAVTRVTTVTWIGGVAREDPGFADSACAGLGLAALLIALAAFVHGPARRPVRPLAHALPITAFSALGVAAMVVSGTHAHAHEEAVGHGHATTLAPVPYDPSKPIDLGGVEGVTAEQQAAAENLVSITVLRLPQWADTATAEAAGFRSIGDGLTGTEHYVQWDWIDDGVVLDPDRPESLVYRWQADGTKKLVSAMYMLPPTVALGDVPELGGPLTQWHIHDDLCFTADPAAPRVAGVTDASGNCRLGLQKFPPSPMIHVWIVPHECGPFAALEGLAAGQIAPGEERLCDHAHGSGLL